MSKVKLSKAELAALDALIASFEKDDSVQSSSADLSFITAITRVTIAATRVATRATPAIVDIATAVAGGAANKSDLPNLTDAKGKLNLEALIKLREEANK